MRTLATALLVIGSLIGAGPSAYAQASLAGVVKDATGAVLPGVTVEALSPALIEKSKAAVTDRTGQYQIVDLRPGTYTVTFTLVNFRAVRTEGIELTGSFAATVNAVMEVGAVESTITVSAAPLAVDVQSTTKQWVVGHDIIDAVPTARTDRTLAVLIPGISATACAPGGPTCQDVGGTLADQFADLTVHGSTGADQRVTQNGLSLGTLARGGHNTSALPNLGAMEEVTFDSAGVSPEMATGGVRTNFIPREGGNVFKGALFAGGTWRGLQGTNVSADLKNRGLVVADAVNRNWDINPGVGGPVKRNRLWFYATTRYNGVWNYAGGMFYNRNANDPTAWTYVPDVARQASNNTTWKDLQIRLTWQAAPRHKFGFTYGHQERCSCPYYAIGSTSPEAGADFKFPVENSVITDWSAPLTTRLLLEGGLIRRVERFGDRAPVDLNRSMVAAIEAATGFFYRARATYADTLSKNLFYRAAMTYVTGAHALKVGFTNGNGFLDTSVSALQPMSVLLFQGVPDRLNLHATPYRAVVDEDADLGVYLQDKWAIRRLTLNLGLRYDYFSDSIPEQSAGPATLAPNRNATFPATNGVAWHDLTPKTGASYDLYGDGKTAVKVTANKYLASQGLTGTFGLSLSPVSRSINTTSRSWNDANRNFVPDCNLADPQGNGECGPMFNPNFGKSVPGTTYDPATLRGWGRRSYNWELSAGVQHELRPGLPLDVTYYRRWYGNFTVTDNRTVGPSDYDPYSITAPVDPRLPGAGGYVVSGLYDLNPAKFGIPADNYVTFSDTFGRQIQHWNGVDAIVSGHPAPGVLVRGGISTGRTLTDRCDVVANVDNPSPLYCRQDSGFLTDVKFLGVYVIPKVDVQVSGAFQSLPGPALSAIFFASNEQIAPSLGRTLSGGARNAAVNLIAPGMMYGDRINQIDLRFGKIVKFARVRTVLNVDLYNAFNAVPVLAEASQFGIWRRPLSILMARLVKFGLQLDF